MRNTFVEINENLSDDEIIEKINNGDYELLHIIIRRYNGVIFYYTQQYCPEAYREDAVQEASFALYSAVKNFDPQKSSFKTFAALCIKRSVIDVLKGQQSRKNIPDELLEPIDDLDIADCNSPEKIFFEREDLKLLTDNIRLELSPLEFKVLQHYLASESYREIAERLAISEKSVNNALSRIRKKLKR